MEQKRYRDRYRIQCRNLLGIVIMFVLGMLLAPPAFAAVVRPFIPRFSINDSGDVLLIGNTLGSCPVSDSRCANAQAGVSGPFNNNSYDMALVDVDADSATFNSSSASLMLPPTTTAVLWAGLYWGGDVNNDALALDRVQLKVPEANAYVTLTASQLDTTDSVLNGRSRYQGFVEITEYVQAAGEGTYTVANVQTTAGNRDSYAGWSIVVVYKDPHVPLRNLTVFDGYAFVTQGDPDISIPVSGFLTPFVGPVNTSVGVVAYEGDWALVGDHLELNNTVLNNDLNPTDNFFNSTNSAFNDSDTMRNPNYVNHMGIDIDVVSAGDLLGNGATEAMIHLTTNNDAYYPGVVTFRTNVYVPRLNDDPKSVRDLNGGDVMPNDILEYQIHLENIGLDTAANLIFHDPIPAYTTYVPNSLQITGGANAGAKSDASGDDQAEFDVANNRVVFRLGEGATATNGGLLAPTETTTLTFHVVIDADVPAGTVISNQGVSDYTAQTLGLAATQRTNEVAVTVPALDLVITKSDGMVDAAPGDTLVYTLQYENVGAVLASQVVITETVPQHTTFSASASDPNWQCGDITPGATCTLLVGDLPVGSDGMIAFAVEIDAPLTTDVVIENIAFIGDDGTHGSDLTPQNNSSQDITTSAPTAVELVAFRIEAVNGRSVILYWETAAEIDNFGFRVYRHSSNNFAAAQLIHFQPSPIGTGTGVSYRYLDTVPNDNRYWYWLEDVDTSGETAVHGPILARVSRLQQQFLPVVFQ